MLELLMIKQCWRWLLLRTCNARTFNPIEVSLSYQRLIDECNLTQEKLSERIGKSRSAVTNFLRLLNLPKLQFKQVYEIR